MPLFIIYLLSFFLSLCVSYVILVMNVDAAFRAAGPDIILTVPVLPALAAVATFVLVFGLAAGLKPGVLFWLAALGLGGLAVTAMVLAIFSGVLNPLEAAFAATLIAFGLGWLIVRRSIGRGE
ncbi:MAG: hypothetical protein HC844_03485 [Tabrizicola sp.]|nr:hypothetical protein [Tabrizicola sp.]